MYLSIYQLHRNSTRSKFDELEPHYPAHILCSGKYDLDFKNPDSDKSKWLTGKELADVYIGMIKKYGIISIEDPFDQDDWEAWVHFTNAAGIQVVGDDLTVTNVERIKTAIEKTACNSTSVLSSPSQC